MPAFKAQHAGWKVRIQIRLFEAGISDANHIKQDDLILAIPVPGLNSRRETRVDNTPIYYLIGVVGVYDKLCPSVLTQCLSLTNRKLRH